MAVAATDCLMCEVEKVRQARATEIRRELNKMNPATDLNYDVLFKVLIDVDGCLRRLRGAVRGRRR